MTDHADRARRFLELHRAPAPLLLLLLPNPWDVGSARLLAWAGFDALATTSSGMAAAAGELDGNVTRAHAHAHARAREIAAATPLPVNGDLENGFGDGPADVAVTVGLALDAGLAGCSIEDWSGSALYDVPLARERIVAAAHGGSAHLVLTARAENHIRGTPTSPTPWPYQPLTAT
jgi:2-methylisocitrate lyase-like PEP mutase family enzyme